MRAAEQLPLASLQTFAKMKDGQAMLNVSPTGAQVIVLAGSRSQPVTLEQAKPAIEQFLLNDRKRDIIAKDLKAMRAAATIEYVGKYGEGPATPEPSAASAPSAPRGWNEMKPLRQSFIATVLGLITLLSARMPAPRRNRRRLPSNAASTCSARAT